VRLIAALCLVVTTTTASGHTIEGRIVGVHDGDTITLLDAAHRQHKIRLDGIDAPVRGHRPMLRELARLVNAEIREARNLVDSVS
jgi:endonuclease YncB( thermonuclease family)